MKVITDLLYINGKVSLLRCCFVILMLLSIYVWTSGNAVPDQMINFMYGILVYLFGDKFSGKLAPKDKKRGLLTE